MQQVWQVSAILHRYPVIIRELGLNRRYEQAVLTRSHNVDLSRSFDGTGGRVQRVLKRAMAGEPIEIGAMGGSSQCPILHARAAVAPSSN